MDPELVVAAQLGDREAFATLARASGDRLFGIARRILRDHERAEDAVQNALVIAWRELPRLRDPDRFEAWLTRLLVNDCYEDYRRTRRHDAHVRTLPVDGPVGPDDTQRVLDRDQLDRGFGRGYTWGEVIIHEIGHVLGLSHVDARKQVMYFQTIRRDATWGAGDLRGLRKVGDSRGCLTRIPARAVAEHQGITGQITHR